MTQDEIIDAASMCGLHLTKQIEAFAKLVEERTAAKEREECDQLINDDSMLSDNDAIRLSRAIRARAQADGGEQHE